MLQRLIFISLCCFNLSAWNPLQAYAETHGQPQTFQLRMDKQLHTSLEAINSMNHEHQNSTDSPIPTSTEHSSSTFQLWWLLAIPALFLLMGLGWFMAQYIEKRSKNRNPSVAKEPWIRDKYNVTKKDGYP